MRSITFRFERWGDIEDLMRNNVLLDMVNADEIKVCADRTWCEFKVYFNEPFDSYVIQGVFDLVYTYTIYN